MKDIRTAIIKHKKIVCIVGLLFVILLECCVFPVGSITHTKWFTIGIINLITAVGICKCVGEMEATLFPKASWGMISLVNIGITIMGMVSRYLLEYGEVSNFVTIIMGYVGIIIGAMLNLEGYLGIIFAIATMGAFILHAIDSK